MFDDSKYVRWYYRIVEIARAHPRPKGKRCALHHVIPRSLGGSDEPSNLVRLTLREHYICHLLLVKMTRGVARSKMVFAFFRFQPKDSGVTSSKAYERFVLAFSKSLTGEQNPFFGKRHTLETRHRISEVHGMRGRSCYDVWLEQFGEEEAIRRRAQMLDLRSKALSGPANPMFGRPRTQAQREHHARAMTGKGNPNFGKLWAWINREGATKRVLRDRLPRYLEEGWQPGRKRKVISACT